MPVEFTLDHVHRIVRSRAWDVISERELLGHVQQMHQLFADGTLDGTWRQLADFTGAASLEEVSASGVRLMAENNPWPCAARRVFLAPTPLTFGLSRMYQLMTGCEEDGLTVVQSEDEALALLNAESSTASKAR